MMKKFNPHRQMEVDSSYLDRYRPCTAGLPFIPLLASPGDRWSHPDAVPTEVLASNPRWAVHACPHCQTRFIDVVSVGAQP